MSSFNWYSNSKDSNRDNHDTTSSYLSPLFTSAADLQLRFLCPSDLDQVKDLCKEWFPIQYPEAWYRDITSDPRFYSLAAVYQSKLVGLLIAEVKQSDAINKEDKGILDGRMYSNCTVGYILSLGVCSTFRRQGVASLLLDSFLNHVTQSENQICKAIYLHVLTMNSAAIRFYEKHYFRLHSFLPYYYSVDGKCKDGFTYVLYINGGHPPWGLLLYLSLVPCVVREHLPGLLVREAEALVTEDSINLISGRPGNASAGDQSQIFRISWISGPGIISRPGCDSNTSLRLSSDDERIKKNRVPYYINRL